MSLFLLERFGGKFLRQTASVASCKLAAGPCMQPECDRRGWTSSGELVKPLVDAGCVNEGFHGIPVPYLATCIFDGKCLPEASRKGDNLGRPWYVTSFRMARGYTGVLIGRGWVACIVLGTLASQTTAKTRRQYAGRRKDTHTDSACRGDANYSVSGWRLVLERMDGFSVGGLRRVRSAINFPDCSPSRTAVASATEEA